MKPRTAHLAILSVLCVAPFCFGVNLVLKNQDFGPRLAQMVPR